LNLSNYIISFSQKSNFRQLKNNRTSFSTINLIIENG
jgi:hypothetical protein